MSKRPKIRSRRHHRRPRDLHLAVSHGSAPATDAAWPSGSIVILLALGAIVAGYMVARSRMPAAVEFSAHDTGAPFIPGTTVRFGQEEPATAGNNDDLGEVVEPDLTEAPGLGAQGQNLATGESAAVE